MREPIIDMTALVAQLRGVDEDYYANNLEEIVDKLNEAKGNKLSPGDVSFLETAISELNGGNAEERKIAGKLREFVNRHK